MPALSEHFIPPKRTQDLNLDSSPTNATSEHQGSPQLPRQGGKQVPIAQLWQALDAYHNCFGQERKASQMTEDAAGPAALPPLVTSVPSSCDPDNPPHHHLEDEYLLSPTTSYCFQMIET
ncbi:hypothetical protein FCOIX_153 [Fusarium coicis]|nr:hypothetical protein FCOIX_153 [Fusarium coicis]